MASCSKEDSSKDPVTQKGEDISRSQIVTVNVSDITLSENEYQGTLDGVAITLTKSEDNKLVFLLPYSTTLGTHILTIPALNNVTVSYDVKNTELSGTPDATMGDFFTNLNTFSQTLDSSPEAISVKNNLAVFNSYYANATLEEKTEIAILYKANKAQFDELFLYDYKDMTGRSSIGFFERAQLAVAKHSKAVALMASGVALITVGSPVAIAVGVVAAGVGAYKAYKANEEAVDNLVATIGTEFGGFFGISNKKTSTVLSSVLTFSDGVSNQFSFNVKQRNIIETDKSQTEPLALEYFKSHDLYNYNVNKDNLGIEKINNDKKTTFSAIPLETLPTTNPEITTIVDSEIFNNVKFTITDPNLKLVSVSLEKDGQLNMKIQVVGTTTTYPVESFLNYSYSDGFSSTSGKLPIKVNNNLVGTWKLESFENGIPVGEYFNQYGDICPSIAFGKYTFLSDVVVFKEDNTFTDDSTMINVNFQLGISSDCTILNDGKDTSATDHDIITGKYVLKGNILETTDDINPGQPDSASIVFITKDKFKLEHLVYVRQ